MSSGGDLEAEVAAIARFAGSIIYHRRANEVGLHVDHTSESTIPRPALELSIVSASGATVRRVHQLIRSGYGVSGQLLVRQTAGQRTRQFGLRLTENAEVLAVRLGLVDESGHVAEQVPDRYVTTHVEGWLRGTVIAAATFSAPGQPPHVEFHSANRSVADQLAAVLRDVTTASVSVGPHRDHVRVAVKSGRAIGDLLAYVGATKAFLAWDDRRLRRQLRAEANRLANADSANLQRTITAAAQQVAQVEAVVARVGWDGLDHELRDIALARIANPELSLAELGAMLEPPLAKSTVSRRLHRLTMLADEDR